MCQHDCEFCATTIETDTVSGTRERGKEHLRNDHYEAFADVFREEYAGKQCGGDCDYTYPTAVEEVAGFDCPDCGHDHFESFASQYLYWRLEVE